MIDFASDLRAPTPTAAAEKAVPVRADLFVQLDDFAHRARSCLAARIERGRERFGLVDCRWPDAGALLNPRAQRVDELGDRLPRSLRARAGASRAVLNLVAGRLRHELLDQRVARLGEKLAAAWKVAKLSHPERPLRRGFVRVTNRDGHTLTSAGQARAARYLSLCFGDGEVPATVDGSESRPAPVERKARRSHIAPQPGLFDAGEE